jgi:hypothetical protein
MRTSLRVLLAFIASAVLLLMGAPAALAATGTPLDPANRSDNPILASNLTGWTTRAGGSALTRISVADHVAASFAAQTTSSTTTTRVRMPIEPINAAGQWTYGADVKASKAGAQASVSVEWYNSTGAFISVSESAFAAVNNTSWTRRAYVGTPPVGAVNGWAQVNVIGTAKNATVTVTMHDVRAPVVATAPAVVTGTASGVGSTTATLNGTVNPNNAATTYHFEYGPTTAYGTSIPVPNGSAGSGSTAVAESANVTGLTASTLYHFRLVATNSVGTTNGTDGTFTTTAASGCVGVTVNPTDDLQALINANGTGTTFCIQSGTQRISAIGGLTPKTNDVFLGVGQNAVISGSKLVGGWAVNGSDWVATGFLPATPPGGGTCDPAFPLCAQAQDIFRDGVWLAPVTARASLAPGKAFLDYANNKIYVRDDPTAHTMEQSWTARLFTGSATGVQIRNLGLQHAADVSNTGALDPALGGTGWVIDHNDIRWNHGYGSGPASNTGFGAVNNMTITANNIHHNGQDGMGADGIGNLVQANEVHDNSYAGYDVSWDAGNKFGHARNIVINGNYVHDERGPGIWCDINCEDATITNNYVTRTQVGIFYEISCRASIHDNTVVDSLQQSIFISNSEGANVYANHTYNGERGIWSWNIDRTEARDCTAGAEHVVKDLNVHDNHVDLNAAEPPWGGKSGLWTDTGRTDLYSTLNNHFQGNTYHDTTPGFEWNWGMPNPPYTDVINFSTWQADGQDTVGGSVVADDPAAPAPPVLVTGPQP